MRSVATDRQASAMDADEYRAGLKSNIIKIMGEMEPVLVCALMPRISRDKMPENKWIRRLTVHGDEGKKERVLQNLFLLGRTFLAGSERAHDLVDGLRAANTLDFVL